MNTEDKQKAMLADDLSVYIKDKHTQEECIGFIDGYNAALTKLKLLDIADVVGRSEQLKPNGSYYTECECGNLVHAREKNCKKCGL